MLGRRPKSAAQTIVSGPAAGRGTISQTQPTGRGLRVDAERRRAGREVPADAGLLAARLEQLCSGCDGTGVSASGGESHVVPVAHAELLDVDRGRWCSACQLRTA